MVKAGELAFGMLIGFICGCMFAFSLFGEQMDKKNSAWEASAVSHGAATWEVDEDGQRVFKWKESNAEEER